MSMFFAVIISFFVGVVGASVAWFFVYRNNKAKMDAQIASLNKLVNKVSSN